MDINKRVKNISIQMSSSILSALKMMDEQKIKMLLVFNDSSFKSILSIGDIQRAILQNIDLSISIATILREEIRVANTRDSFEDIKKLMHRYRIECMPVVDNNNVLIDVHFWKDVFGDESKHNVNKLNLPVIIMAGGKGTRLKPLTNIIPKPLIPIGDNTIIEEIMNRFVDTGCNKFFISVNYKAEIIKQYFMQLNNSKYNINYFQEEKPLGTAGSLFLVKNEIKTTFFVTNCDIVIDEDYSEILKYHRENKNEFTIISALKHFPIPYGTIETKKDGVLKHLLEKPDLLFHINSGMYILEPHLLDEIPKDSFFHITTLIDNIQKRNGRVGVFPISEGSWQDIGNWSEYLSIIKVV